MSRPLPGGPSPPHERRRGELEQFAALLGFTLPHPPPPRLIPDVSLRHGDAPRLFVGEAKHTEGSDDRASAARLLAYLRWLYRVPAAPSHLVAVACPHGQAADWAALLADLAPDVPVVVGSPWVRSFSVLTDVVVVEVSRASGAPT